jgi:hypothetical protein
MASDMSPSKQNKFLTFRECVGKWFVRERMSESACLMNQGTYILYVIVRKSVHISDWQNIYNLNEKFL